jgi:hypothetical protein
MFVLCLLYDSSMEHTWHGGGKELKVQKGSKEQTGQEKKKILPGAWMSVSCECCVLSGRGLCDEPIPRPEESYRLWCV